MRTWSWQRLGSTIAVQDDGDRIREEHRIFTIPDEELAQKLVDALNAAEKAKAGEYEMSQKGKELHDEMAGYADGA